MGGVGRELVEKWFENLSIEVDLLSLGRIEPLRNDHMVEVRNVAFVAGELNSIQVTDLLQAVCRGNRAIINDHRLERVQFELAVCLFRLHEDAMRTRDALALLESHFGLNPVLV